MHRVDERPLRMHVGRLDLGTAAALAQALGKAVRRTPLGVGSGKPALERAELPDHLHPSLHVHAWELSVDGAMVGSPAGVRNWYTRGPQKAVVLRDMWVRLPPPASPRRLASYPCAAGTPSPVPTRTGCGPASTSSSRSRSTTSRASTSRRPTRCWRCGAPDGAHELGRLRWGLVPGRWAEKKGARPLINARAETLAEPAAFASRSASAAA